MKSKLAAPLLLAAAVGCRIVEKAAPRSDEPNVAVVRVFYGTDRKATGHSTPGRIYGADRGALAYGVSDVSVPRDHRMGQYEISWGRKERKPSPETHVFVLHATPKPADGFFAELRAVAQGRPAFVFVHGYNVAFDDALRRTAQMAYDLGFEGTPLAYSWASHASAAAYPLDEAAIEATVPALEAFLAEVAARSGATTVHIVVHSMGNRAVLKALEAIAARPAPRFGEVVHAAPDVDADVFRQSVARARGAARRVTLYASSRDVALMASKEIHKGPRAGDSGAGIVVVPGVDSIDVSAVDTSFLGHSYYGENKSVLSDLRLLLRQGRPPDGRPGLHRREKGGLPYWVLQP